MTSDRNESISALLDDELDSRELDQLLDEMRNNDSFTETWDRYALIGDALRGEAERIAPEGVAARVRAAIAEEPSIVAAPQKKVQTKDTTAGEVRWIRPMAGAALAASVAVMAIYVSPRFTDSPIVESQPIASQTPTLPTKPVSVSTPGSRWKNLSEPAVASKLDKYLREHSEYASPGVMNGVLPYASFVSYDSGSR